MADVSSAVAGTRPTAGSCLIGRSGLLAPSSAIEQSRPMPSASAETVRLVAARMAALAGELYRVQTAVQGAMGADAGWSGSAQLAFQESMTAQLGTLAPIVQRYDEYAAALAGYARDLDYLQPRLQAARSRAEVPGDPSAAAEFERCWREWDAARGRCVARLRATGLGSAGSRHGWWSGLADSVCRVVHPSVSLAGLSRVLSDLGQGLLVAGLVCALVCPPLAGAVWAAVAVVAACQLAVDAARKKRGEPVGWAGLGWDVAAAVPAGRAVRGVRIAVEEVAEYRTAAEADAAIKRLPKHLRSSPVVPGGLSAHEGTATHRGHTLLKHVGKTPGQLIQRFKAEPHLKWSSSFTDHRSAEAAIAHALDKNRDAIGEWLTQSWPTYRFVADVGADVGHSVGKDGTIVYASKVHVTLRKEDTMLGYYIKTAYPTP